MAELECERPGAIQELASTFRTDDHQSSPGAHLARIQIDQTRHSASDSPAMRMPPETVGQVFMLCLPDPIRWGLQSSIPPNPLIAPLLLCNICSSWRAVALSMPQLWTSISAISGTGIRSRPHLNLIQLWLDRSGMCPLSFSVEHSDNAGEDESIGDEGEGESIAESILDMFIPHFSRWQRIKLVFTTTFPKSLLQFPENGASLLEGVQLWLSSDLGSGRIAPTLALSHILASSPRLCTFHWMHQFYVLRSVNLPWWQLTKVNIYSEISIHDVLGMLSMSPKLIELSLDNIAGRPPDSHFPSRLILAPELQSLYIYTDVNLGPLFDELILPALRSITIIHSINVVPAWTQSQLTSLVTRSKCPLESFILKYTNIPEGDLIAFLQNVPCLTYLDITNKGKTSITDQLLLLLTARDRGDGQAPYLCPNLQSIKLGECCFTSTDGILAAMVASRWRRTVEMAELTNASSRVACLRNVWVDFPERSKIHAVDYKRLNEMRDEGLKIDVYDGPQY